MSSTRRKSANISESSYVSLKGFFLLHYIKESVANLLLYILGPVPNYIKLETIDA